MKKSYEKNQKHETAVSRRKFLKTTGVAGIAATFGTSSLEANPKAKGISFDTQALIIGSGFGGAVAGLRLAQRGVQTIMLERGRRWDIRPDGNTFATLQNPDRRLLWFGNSYDVPGIPPFPLTPFAGVLEIINSPVRRFQKSERLGQGNGGK